MTNHPPCQNPKPHNSQLLGCTFFFFSSLHLVALSWGQSLCHGHCCTDQSPGQCQVLKDFHQNVWIEQANGWMIKKSKRILFGKKRQPPRRPGGQEVTLTNHRRRECQTALLLLPWEPHEQYEKTKRYDAERYTPQVGRCPIRYGRGVKK